MSVWGIVDEFEVCIGEVVEVDAVDFCAEICFAGRALG